MNKMLVVVFDNESAAVAGLEALRKLHAEGEITLYATGVVDKDVRGVVSVKKSMDTDPVGTVTGLAVGSLIGLLGGPAGVAVGAVTGSMLGAVRDFWVAGVGMDFIEEVDEHLQPGKVALVAEIEEEWVIPLDDALEAAGGTVLRRTRTEVAEARFDHDIAVLKSDIEALESEAVNVVGAAQSKLQTRLATARTRLDRAVLSARQRVDSIRQEADTKTESLKSQLEQARDDVRSRVADRVKRVQNGYHERGAKLSKAWELTREALTK